MRRRLVVLTAFALVVAVGLLVLGRGSDVRPQGGGIEPTPSEEPSIADESKTPVRNDDLSDPRRTTPAQELTDEQRVAAVTSKMSAVLSATSHDSYVGGLVKAGLSRDDSEKIVRAFLDGLARCGFDMLLHRSEEQGISYTEFLERSERIWSRSPEEMARQLTGFDARGIAQFEGSCVASVSQRAGISVPK
jgi:hypothetical protein